MLDGYTLKKKRHTKWLSVTEPTETSSLWLRASMDDGFACFQISKITALPERVQGGPLTGAHVGIRKASVASVPGDEAGHLGLWHQRWWGGSGSVGTFLLLPQGMQLLSDLLLCFSTQGSTHLRLSLNTCLFLLVTKQNRSERIQRNVVKGARELESEPIWVLLLLDCVALGWSLKFFGPYVHSVSQGCGATLQWPLNISSCSIVQGDAQDPNENASTSTVDYRKWRRYSSYIKVRMCVPAECYLIARGWERPRASRLLLSSFPKAIAKCTCSDQKPPTTSLIPWKQWIQIRVSAGTVCIEYFTGPVGTILLHN